MSILAALHDPHLLGQLSAFHDLHSWRPWMAFLKASEGEPLDAVDLSLFRQHTGRETPREGGYPEAVVITGRQSGKSRIAGSLAAVTAATVAQRGEHVLLVAQDLRGAQRALLGYVEEAFECDGFAQDVDRRTADQLELLNGACVSVYPCRPAALRGIRARFAIVDELAFFTATDGRPTDREMLRAVRPTLATTGGRLLILSSPYGQTGALWDLHRTHYGREDSPVLVWQATAPAMNPLLPADYLARMAEEDPEAYRSEVLGEFRAGIASLFDPEALDAVIVRERREVPPTAGRSYRAFVDPSGGRADAFTLSIGHRDQGRAVVDVVRAWRPPFSPANVVEEAAALLKQYHVQEVTGDRYGGEWPREAFRTHGIEYRVADKDKSTLYLGLLPVVNAGAVELLDVPELERELRGLERRRGTSGRDRVDHVRGAHDDRANAVAGLVSLLPADDVVAGAVVETVYGSGPRHSYWHRSWGE